MEDMGANIRGLLMLVAAAGIGYSIFRLAKPKPPTWTRRRAVYLLAASWIVPGIATAIIAPQGRLSAQQAPLAIPATPSAAVSPAAPTDAEIASFARGVSSRFDAAGLVDQEAGPLKGRLLRISYTRKEAADEESFIVLGAEELRRAAEKITDRYRGHLSGIQIVWNAPTRDPRTGNSDISIAYVLGYPMSDLARINWPNFEYADFLNLALVDAKSVGRKIAAVYCQGASASRVSAKFCKDAARE